MILKLNVPILLYCFAIFQFLSAVKVYNAKQSDQPTGDSSSGQFPISYPPIKYENDLAYVEKPSGNERCLFYAEGLSVVVFATKKSLSAWADYRSDTKESPKYTASIECQGNMNVGSSFDVYLKIEGKAEGIMRADIGKKDAKSVFTVDGAEFILNFNVTQVGFWQLVGATVERIEVKGSSDFLNKNLNVDKKWTLESSVVPSTNINSFKDYSFACGQTNPIVWALKDSNDYAVGITLNNVQFQPFNATYTAGGKEADRLKFGWKVNDCQGLFSIGTWMGLVVATLLIGVLFFGFLMLNSVQTMDRFDDPKQKQLIISSKE
ncbi:hypothetical protein niasHS_005888 [Heterodera schachtii]|uniref:V-type proton ATPase subunit S1/VOA1 transmembrane domain-containing protein n=1 Tax=Heterodera schachtii TaxID=97005 RepID=A0ABD2JRX6_HETSC